MGNVGAQIAMGHTMSNVPSLELQQLEVTVGTERRLLDSLSLHIKTGSFSTFIGPSGIGKSTLFRVLAGLHPESSGRVLVAGTPLSAAQRVGNLIYMPQQDELFPWLTAAQNAALGLRVRGQDRRSAEAIVAQSLTRFGLTAAASRYPEQLSGGMRQRVALMRTLLPDAQIVLLDEPFSALDRMTRTDMQTWLLDIWEQQRRTVLMITHDIEEAILLADEVYVWPAGAQATMQRVPIPFARPRTRTLVFDPSFVAIRRHLEALCFAKEVVDT